MLENVSNTTTIIGLIFFFSFFLGVIIYVFNPANKKKMKQHGEIPLNESEQEN